jgi:hypothetical protein
MRVIFFESAIVNQGFFIKLRVKSVRKCEIVQMN